MAVVSGRVTVDERVVLEARDDHVRSDGRRPPRGSRRHRAAPADADQGGVAREARRDHGHRRGDAGRQRRRVELGVAEGGPLRRQADRLLRRQHVPGADRRHLRGLRPLAAARTRTPRAYLHRGRALRRRGRASRRSGTPSSSRARTPPERVGRRDRRLASTGRSSRSSPTRSPCASRRRAGSCTASRRSRRCSTARTRPARRSRAIAGADGPVIGISTACTASAHSIGEAFRLIQDDEVDVMVAGGFDALHDLVRPARLLAARRADDRVQRRPRARVAAVRPRPLGVRARRGRRRRRPRGAGGGRGARSARSWPSSSATARA